jgi:hypothetical protein
VRDLNFSLAFCERLGFRTDTYDEGYGFARRERLRLHLRVMPELDPLANNSGVYVDAPAVDALHSEWLACGLRIVAADIQEADERACRITETVEAKPDVPTPFRRVNATNPLCVLELENTTLTYI